MFKLPIAENRIELLVRFLLPLLFRQMVENLWVLFGLYCNISAYTKEYELKFSIQTNFDTLISNLKSYFQYYVVMMSCSKNFLKNSFANSPHIYRFSVTNNHIFGTNHKYSILFPTMSQKSRIFGR